MNPKGLSAKCGVAIEILSHVGELTHEPREADLARAFAVTGILQDIVSLAESEAADELLENDRPRRLKR